jgi:hypothetical protein
MWHLLTRRIILQDSELGITSVTVMAGFGLDLHNARGAE